MNKKITIVVYQGKPYLWEEGGFNGKNGFARIITDSDGKAKVAKFIKLTGNLANKKHAMIEIKENDFIIESTSEIVKDNDENAVSYFDVFQVKSISIENSTAVLTSVNKSKKIELAIDIATQKSCYEDCKEAQFIKNGAFHKID